jgi:Ca2+-binding EF-hand superfamily protein
MIATFDDDRSGTIDIKEFEQLYNNIKLWEACFKKFDRDNSGSIEQNELSQAITAELKVKLTPQVVQSIISVYDPVKKRSVKFDHFIEILFRVTRLINAFRAKAPVQTGLGFNSKQEISLELDEFISLAVNSTI